MSDWWLMSLLGMITLAAISCLLYPLKNKIFSCFGFPVLLFFVFLSYSYWGSFSSWQQAQQAQKIKQQAKKMLRTIKTPDELIVKLKERLDDSAKSAKGWYLLGRLYSAKGDYQNAVLAFSKAYNFFPNNEQYIANYALGLWQSNHQQFNESIVSLLKKLLSKNPDQPDALAMLAMNAFLSHDYQAAINYWQHLLDFTPPQSKEALTIHKAITKAQERINEKETK